MECNLNLHLNIGLKQNKSKTLFDIVKQTFNTIQHFLKNIVFLPVSYTNNKQTCIVEIER